MALRPFTQYESALQRVARRISLLPALMSILEDLEEMHWFRFWSTDRSAIAKSVVASGSGGDLSLIGRRYVSALLFPST